jgi:hypothetical protein
MSESSGEQEHESGQQGIPDEALPEDVRPAEDNPLADPDQQVGEPDEEDPTDASG